MEPGTGTENTVLKKSDIFLTGVGILSEDTKEWAVNSKVILRSPLTEVARLIIVWLKSNELGPVV